MRKLSPAHCAGLKKTPKTIVNKRANIESFLFPLINAWCDHVTVAPDDNRIAVFNNGTSNGLKACIPTGGQPHLYQ